MKKKLSRLSLFEWLIVVVVILTVVVRLLEWKQFNKFAGDEGIQLITVNHFLTEGRWPLSGEISGVDVKSRYIFHNSAWGFYWQSLIYVLGLGIAEGYSLIYVIISVCQLILFYRATEYFFFKKAAFLTLVLLGFSSGPIYWSNWSSQPVNAIFFQTLAFYFLALAYKKKSELWFWWSTVTAVFCIQFYPPMYFWLPVMMVIFANGFRSLVINKKSFILRLLTALGVIYLPMAVFEVKSGMMNTTMVSDYLKTSGGFSLNSLKTFFDNMRFNFGWLIQKTLREKWRDWNVPLMPSLLIGLLLAWRKNKELRAKIGILMVLILVFISLVSVFQGYVNYVYFYSLVPYFFILTGLCLSQLGRKWTVILGVILTCYFVRIHYNDFFILTDNKKETSLQESKKIAAVINDDRQLRKMGLEDISLYTVSRGDSWNWDGPMYWYLLERLTKTRLVEINPFSSKAERISDKPVKVYYLICVRIPDSKAEKDCKKKFMDNFLYEDKIRFVEDKSFGFEDSFMYVLFPVYQGLPVGTRDYL